MYVYFRDKQFYVMSNLYVCVITWTWNPLLPGNDPMKNIQNAFGMRVPTDLIKL